MTAATQDCKVCSICEREYIGFGNNAWPINDGRCCDDCNSAHVIRTRIVRMFAQKEKNRQNTRR